MPTSHVPNPNVSSPLFQFGARHPLQRRGRAEDRRIRAVTCRPAGAGRWGDEAVPSGISYAGGTLLVTLLRGLPFPPNTSRVLQVDPATGEQSALVSGLKTAIAVTEVRERGSSGPGPFCGGPGLVLRVEAAGATPSLIANCPHASEFDGLRRKGRIALHGLRR